MAEVYIKDFRLPETCAKCPLKHTMTIKKVSWCLPTGRTIKNLTERAEYCPLQEK